MNYANLIQNITENIKTNGSQAITAQVLQDVLVDMVGELGQSGALLGGVIDTSFVPDPTNDAQVVYIAEAPGTYTNFNGLVVGAGEVAFFYFDGNAWAKSSVDVLEVVNNLTSTATDKALSAAMGKQLQDALTQAVQDLTTAIGNKADRQTTEQALNTLQNQINDKADTTYVNSQLATKADTASVNAALALKADTSAVNAALATKADTSALATKADKVVGAVAGNMAGLDADGNLVDSGVPASAVGDVADKIDKVHDAEVGNVPMFKADGGIEDSGIPADNVAEQDGYYETMVVGGAENLIGNDIVSSQFTRRKTGGAADVGTGVAILKTIKGNTLVVNQLVDMSNLQKTFTNTADGGFTNQYQDITPVEIIAGHKYYIVPTQTDCPANTYLYYDFRNSSYSNVLGNAAPAPSPQSSTIQTAGTTATASKVLCRFCNYTGAVISTATVTVKIRLIDLTQWFGSGNEPSSVAELKALFPLIDSLPYNTGSLLNLTATGLQTNGFNQWDEEWESGKYNLTTGEPEPAATQIRSKNYIPVFGNTDYYFQFPLGVGNLVIMRYDIDKNYLGYNAIQPSIRSLNAETRYIRFYMTVTYGTTYNHDICINLSDVNKNGTYEPYWSETKALPITTATSGGVAIFSDGMKSAGTAHDRYYKSAGSDLFNKAEKQIVEIDLGSVNWNYAGGTFYTGVMSNLAIQSNVLVPANIRCAKYTTVADGSLVDGCISENINPRIRIKDSNYTDAATFKTAMSGVYAYAELATHTDYTLDTPFNTQYKVDNDGTETILPENTSAPTTSPIVADINYALNAIDTIRNLPQNYISKASMDAILTAFKTAGVITNYTLTWDATNQKYNCTITA